MLDNMMDKPCNKCNETGWLDSEGKPYKEAKLPETKEKEFDKWCKDNNITTEPVGAINPSDTCTIIDDPFKNIASDIEISDEDEVAKDLEAALTPETTNAPKPRRGRPPRGTIRT